MRKRGTQTNRQKEEESNEKQKKKMAKFMGEYEIATQRSSV